MQHQPGEKFEGAARTLSDLYNDTLRRFALARRYCLIAAASACLLTWTHHGFNEELLTAMLRRVLARLRGGDEFDLPESIFEQMTDQFRRHQLFSLLPVALGE